MLPDEDVLGSPSRPTLVILGSICAATLIMWAAGRAACNYHVPGESLTPRAVSLEERIATAKGAAIEFAQALSGGDFERARLVAQGEALSAIERESASCPSGCSERKKDREALRSVAELWQSNSTEAYVKVRTGIPPAGETERALHLKRDGLTWKVAAVLDAGASFPELQAAPLPGIPIPGQGENVAH